MSEDEIKIHRGLNNVYFDRTKTTYINGKEGILEYRGFNIHDLAEKSSFEEVSYLLLYGKLPTISELKSFKINKFLVLFFSVISDAILSFFSFLFNFLFL